MDVLGAPVLACCCRPAPLAAAAGGAQAVSTEARSPADADGRPPTAQVIGDLLSAVVEVDPAITRALTIQAMT